MSRHSATVRWARPASAAFTDRRYTRTHTWHFDGGAVVAAAASPHVVPLPFTDASAVDPEEAFVAALASCHLLWFLDFAARAGHVVVAYDDEAEGELGPDADGRLAFLRITLRPRVVFGAPVPPDELHALHEAAHDACFLARSVKAPVEVVPR